MGRAPGTLPRLSLGGPSRGRSLWTVHHAARPFLTPAFLLLLLGERFVPSAGTGRGSPLGPWDVAGKARSCCLWGARGVWRARCRTAFLPRGASRVAQSSLVQTLRKTTFSFFILDVNHSNSGSHYENSQRGPESSTSDSSTHCQNAAVNDAPGEAAWPSAPGAHPEPASQGAGADSASGSESERHPATMASGRAGERDGLRDSPGLGPQSKFVVAGGGGVARGSSAAPWGFPHGAVISTCQVPADAPTSSRSEGGSKAVTAWGVGSPSSNGGPSPSTLHPASNHGAWPALESNGLAPRGPGAGQAPGSQSVSAKAGASSPPGAWGSLQETCDSEVSGTQKASFSGQPQTLATEAAGPNNTTHFTTSSLPSPGPAQSGEPPGSVGARRAGAGPHPQTPAPAALHGPALPQLSNGEPQGGGSHGTTWGAYGAGYPGDTRTSPNGQANGDTVNAALVPPGANGPGGASFQGSTSKAGGAWEPGAAHPQGTSWASGHGAGGGRRGWAAPVQGAGADAAGTEWGQLPGAQHASDGAQRFTNGWKAAEEEGQGPAPPQASEQGGPWARAGGAGDSDGSSEDRAPGDAQSRERRKLDPHALLQSIVSRADLDPRVLSNSGWGQTPIKQNTAWDTEASPRGARKAWGGPAAQAPGSGPCAGKTSPSGHEAASGAGWGEPRPPLRWADAKGSDGQGGWEDGAAAGAAGGGQWASCKEEKSAWGDPQKGRPGWGDGQKSHPGWPVPAGDDWGDAGRSSHWGEASKKSSSGGSDSDRSVSGWNELGRASSFTWGNNLNPNNSSGWGESSKPSAPQGWSDPAKAGQALGWGEAKPAGSPDWSKQQEGVGSWGGAPAPGKPPGTGWRGGPMPAPAGPEPTGWEEPSPESIRRKMEIDDGTAAWGDPSSYNYRGVSMWGRGAPGSRPDAPAQGHQLLPPAGAVSNPEAGGGSGKSSLWGPLVRAARPRMRASSLVAAVPGVPDGVFGVRAEACPSHPGGARGEGGLAGQGCAPPPPFCEEAAGGRAAKCCHAGRQPHTPRGVCLSLSPLGGSAPTWSEVWGPRWPGVECSGCVCTAARDRQHLPGCPPHDGAASALQVARLRGVCPPGADAGCFPGLTAQRLVFPGVVGRVKFGLIPRGSSRGSEGRASGISGTVCVPAPGLGAALSRTCGGGCPPAAGPGLHPAARAAALGSVAWLARPVPRVQRATCGSGRPSAWSRGRGAPRRAGLVAAATRARGASPSVRGAPCRHPACPTTPFPTLSAGWGEPWAEPPTPATTVDNGTSAWGRPVDSGPSWGDPVAVASSTPAWGSSSAGPQALSKPGKSRAAPGALTAVGVSSPRRNRTASAPLPGSPRIVTKVPLAV